MKSMIAPLVQRKSAAISFMTIALMALMCVPAFAFTAPASGDMFYEVYDLVINSILSGPVGFVVGAIMLVGGIFLLVQGKGFLLPLICLVGGVILVKVDSIVQSFGFSMDAAVETANSVSQFLM